MQLHSVRCTTFLFKQWLPCELWKSASTTHHFLVRMRHRREATYHHSPRFQPSSDTTLDQPIMHLPAKYRTYLTKRIAEQLCRCRDKIPFILEVQQRPQGLGLPSEKASTNNSRYLAGRA